MTEITGLEGLPLDPRQTLAYAEWRRLSGDGGTPRQQDFRPDRITRALPAAMLLHVERDGSRIALRQRLEGRFVTLAFGDGGGGVLEDIYTDEHLYSMMPRYLEAAMTGDSAMMECSAPQRDGKPFEFTQLVLPFTGTDGRVNRLLAVFYFEPVALARLAGPLKVRREATQELYIPSMAGMVTGFAERQAG